MMFMMVRTFNLIAAMKKFMKSLVLFAAAAMALTSCENEMMNEGIESNEAYTLTFTADAPESRTSVSIEGNTASFSWSETETFAVLANDANGMYVADNVTATIEGGKAKITASFTSNTPAEGATYVAVYPASAYVTSSNTNFNSVKLKMKEKEHALVEGTFDPAADLMISQPVTAVPNETTNLKFGRLASVARMNLKGVTAGETIENIYVEFTDVTITNGRYRIDLATGLVIESDNNAPYYGFNYLNLKGSLIAAAETPVFFTCLPGDYSGDYVVTVKTNAANYSKEGTIDATKPLAFTAGNVLGFNLTVGNRVEKEEIAAIEIPFTENFDTENENFTIENVNLGGLTYVWKHDSSSKYMKASAYVNPTNYATESWLISPFFNLTSAVKPVLTFDHAGNYFANVETMKDEIGVYAREKDGEWVELTIPTYPANAGWTFVNSDEVSLSAFVGKEAQIGFKYTSTATKAGTWEIDNLYVGEAPFSMSANITSVELENTASNGTIEVTTKNGENYTLSAALKEANDWLTVSMTGNVISYSATANNDASRYATIVVTATNGTDTQTIEIAVSQAASQSAAEQEGSVTIDFTKPSNYGFTTPATSAGTDLGNGSVVATPITLTATSGGTPTRFWNTSGNITFRIYKNATMTFTADSGYTIKSIELTVKSGSLSAASGNFSNNTWTGSASDVTLTCTANAQLTNAVITYTSGGSTEEPVEKEERNLAWSAETATATVGEAFTAPTLSGVTDGVTYTSSNTGVATINASGVVTIVAAGTTTITATAAENETYRAGEASYTLTVSEGGGDATGSVTIDCSGGDNTNHDTITISNEGYTLTVTAGTHQTAPRWDSDCIRFYGTGTQHNTLTISGGNDIQSVVFTCTTTGYATALAAGTVSVDNGASATISASGTDVTITVTGSTKNVTLTGTTAQSRFSAVTIN